MIEDPISKRDLLVVVEATKPTGLSADEFFNLRREISLLILSVNGRMTIDPLNAKQENVLQAAFEITERMQKTVEDTLLGGLEIESKLKGRVVINKIPSVESPELGIYID